jgi:hypothetical protein
MENKYEKEFVPEVESNRLKLDWFDLRAGHWPDSKDPPWGLNITVTIKNKWPDIIKVLEKISEEMSLGEERVFWSGEIEFPDGRMEYVEIKLWKRKINEDHSSTDLWIWPKANKYYKKK